jgi:hypothetical protein
MEERWCLPCHVLVFDRVPHVAQAMSMMLGAFAVEFESEVHIDIPLSLGHRC